MRELWRPILRSASVGTINRVVAVAIRLLTVPLLLRHLGLERYGLWVTVASLTGYVTLLDFGMGSALVNRQTVQFQRGRGARASAYLWAATGFLIVVAIVAFLIALTAVLATDLPRILKLETPLASAEVRPTVIVVLAAAFVQLSLAAIQRVPYAMQRGYIAELGMLVGNCASLAGIVIGVRVGMGLPFLAAALMAAPIIASLSVLPYLIASGLVQLRGVLDWRRGWLVLRVLWRDAPNFVTVQVVATLAVALQFSILAYYWGAATVAPYGLMSQALIAVQTPLTVLQQPLWTRVAALFNLRDLGGIRAMIRQYFAVAALYSVLAGLVLIFLVNPVLALIMDDPITISLGLRAGFAAACTLGLLFGGNLGSILFAMELSRYSAWVSVAQLVIFAPLALLLTPSLGALGPVLANIASQVATIPWLVRVLQSGLRRFGPGNIGGPVATTRGAS